MPTRHAGSPVPTIEHRGWTICLTAASVLALLLLVLPAVTGAPGTVTPVPGDLEGGLHGAAVAHNGTHVLLFGGASHQGDGVSLSAEILSYEVGSGEVTSMEAMLPSARKDATAVWTGERAVIFGGWGCPEGLFEEPSTCTEILSYDPEADTLSTMAAELPDGMEGHRALWDGQHAYLFGGQAHTEVMAYDPAGDRLEPMGIDLPHPVSKPAVAWLDGEAYLAGGAKGDGTLVDELVRVNLEAGTAHVLDLGLPTVRNASTMVTDGQALYVLGGQGPDGPLSEVVRVDLDLQLAHVREARLATASFDQAVVWHEDRALLFGGQDGSASQQGIVAFTPGNQAPVPSFQAWTDGYELTLNASPTWDPEGDEISYAWAWGDGNTTPAGENVTHRYAHAGTYPVTLTALDEQGNQATATSNRVITNTPPTAAFNVTHQGLTLHVDAGNSTDPDGTPLTYAWRFGDAGATATGETATHTFTTQGTYRVELTVTDLDGKKDTTARDVQVTAGDQGPTARFSKHVDGLNVTVTAQASRDPAGQGLTYAWDWGNGASATGVEAEHTYDEPGPYTLVLTVTDGEGRQDQATTNFALDTGQEAPQASLTTERRGATILADARDSFDPDGEIVAYAWTWGDGSPPSTGPQANHTYRKGGTYVVLLEVTDDAGATTTDTAQVTIPNQPPTAGFTAEASGLEVATDASPTIDPEEEKLTYRWAWGDGRQTTGAQATHRYEVPGTYQITLTATDHQGAQDTVVEELTVREASAAPSPAEKAAAATGTGGQAANASTLEDEGMGPAALDDPNASAGGQANGQGDQAAKGAPGPGLLLVGLAGLLAAGLRARRG